MRGRVWRDILEEQAGEEQGALERGSEEETEHVSEERRQAIFQKGLRGERSLEGEGTT